MITHTYKLRPITFIMLTFSVYSMITGSYDSYQHLEYSYKVGISVSWLF
jgi:hypothetical protein